MLSAEKIESIKSHVHGDVYFGTQATIFDCKIQELAVGDPKNPEDQLIFMENLQSIIKLITKKKEEFMHMQRSYKIVKR